MWQISSVKQIEANKMIRKIIVLLAFFKKIDKIYKKFIDFQTALF